MGLSDCIKCWDTPCTCGWEYRNWGIEKLAYHIGILNKVLMFKKQSSNLKFSMMFSDPETEDDHRLEDFIKGGGT